VRGVFLSTALVLGAVAPARAEGDPYEPGVGIAIEAVACIEGAAGGPEDGIRRTRTVLLAGPEANLWGHLLSLYARVEVEPDASIGGDFRYGYRVLDPLVIHGSAAAVFYPGTLFGAGLGIAYRPRLSDLVEMGVGPYSTIFFAGSDLPDEIPAIWQLVVAVSIHIWP
jgi:hypothetical protein